MCSTLLKHRVAALVDRVERLGAGNLGHDGMNRLGMNGSEDGKAAAGASGMGNSRPLDDLLEQLQAWHHSGVAWDANKLQCIKDMYALVTEFESSHI